ncbi:hypothetical protein BGZ54_003335 [Gamsiella multidivaricata]|nr:hypothetical protein BGZ54_003335 [Gamsiella multidivaricata]
MRALTAPPLVRVMASKSLRLYFYQEYVRRVGIDFVFDHFDLERDRVVFRPQIMDHQHRFRCGLTLQSPQLEEIAVESMTKSTIATHQVQLSRSRYYIVLDNKAVRESASTASTVSISQSASTLVASKPFPTTGSGVRAPATPSSETPEAVVSEPVEGQRGGPLKRTTITDERGYKGSNNFLDKTCPVHIRKDGTREIDGTRYCFLQSYPWSLHYQVARAPFSSRSSEAENHSDSGGKPKKREQFFFDIHEELRAQAQPSVSGRANGDGDDNRNISPEEGYYTNVNMSSCKISRHPGIALCEINTATTNTYTKTNSTANNGPRYFRVLRFECSMNFLDPKRATRNIIGRWLEGKVHRWKKALASKKQPQQLSGADAGAPEQTNQTTARGNNSSRVIHTIDSILGSPSLTIACNSNSNGSSRHPAQDGSAGIDGIQPATRDLDGTAHSLVIVQAF